MTNQKFSVKRAQVEWHNFASLGEPERNMRIYLEENQRRAAGGAFPNIEIGHIVSVDVQCLHVDQPSAR